MNYRQVNKVVEVLTKRGYKNDLINLWLKRDVDIIEQYLNISLSELDN